MRYAQNVKSLILNNTSSRVLWVSDEMGNDANDGSFANPFKTIQAGINAAAAIPATYNTPVIVKVYPSTGSGVYTENITISQQGIVLEAISSVYHNNLVSILGNVTVNLSGTAGGANFTASENTVFINGFFIKSASSSDCLTFSGTAFQRLFLQNCFLQNTSTGSAITLSNTGVSGSKSTITVRDCDFENNNASAATITVLAGRMFVAGANPSITNNNASGMSVSVTGASAAGPSLTINGTSITGQVSVTDNTANVTISLSALNSGSLPIVTPSSASTGVITLAQLFLTTTATNSVTGSGVVVPAQMAKLSTGGDIISTVTQAVLAQFPQGQTLIGAGATAVTNSLLVIKNGHITSQQTTAPTSALQAGAGTTATRTLTRCTDVAGNISITVNGLGIAAGAQLIITFNKPYSTAPVGTLTPTSANSSQVIGAYMTTTTTTATINFAVAGVAGTVYPFYCSFIGT